MKQPIGKLTTAALATLLGIMAAPQAPAAEIVIDSNITNSTTWTANNVYVLSNIIYVINGATLTIEPGTLIRCKSDAETTPNDKDPGTLVITRGSKIYALGTREKPIIFTNDEDDQVPGGAQTDTWSTLNEDWGGVVILGRAYIAVGTASGPNPAKDNQIEGLTSSTFGRYGPDGSSFLVDDDDDSGCIQYVSIRYGGNVLGTSNEINGLTMGAVGRETEIRFVESLNNKDDAFEWFGGTVNCSHLIAFGQGDDAVDYDEGFRGKVQFFLGVKQDCNGPLEGGYADKGGELDGGLSPDGSEPYSIPTLANVTWIGHGAANTWTNPVTQQRDSALHFRDNAGGRFWNSIFADFGGAGIILEYEGGATGTNSHLRSLTPYSAYSPNAGAAFYPGPDAGTMQLEVKNSIWYGRNWDTNPLYLAPTNGSGFGGANLACTGTNQFVVSYSNLVVSALPLVNVTRGGSVRTGGPAVITNFDPRPTLASGALTNWRPLPADDFLVTVPYCGAFSPSNNWAKGWTAIDALGLLDPAPQPTIPEPIGINVVSLSQVDVSVDSDNLVNYLIEASTDLKLWCIVGFVAGDGSTVVFADLVPLADRLFYRAVVE